MRLQHKEIIDNDRERFSVISKPGLQQAEPSRQPRLVCDCDGARDERTSSRTEACFSAPLHLGLLSTCRQTYLEAFPILWSTNFFCFEDSRVMFLTFQSLAPHQISLIKNLRLDINHFVEGCEWELNLQKSDLASLRGLREL